MSNLQEAYKSKIVSSLQEKLGLKNQFSVPKVIKVIINVGTGKNKANQKFQQLAPQTLEAITGQKPSTTIARKSISGFKLRQGEKVGLKVTLRGTRMYDFLEKLANIVLPRVRDFRGLDPKAFDRNGNFTLGISEQIYFPEISHEKAEVLHGMSITINTTAKDPVQGQALLEELGFPFKKDSTVTVKK